MKYVFKKRYLIILMTVLDAIGYILTSPSRIWRGRESVKTPSRVLLIRLDHIGDVIMSTGAVRLLRDKYPEMRIDLMVSPPAVDIIRDNPRISRVIPFDAPWFRRTPSGRREEIRAFFRLIKEIKKNDYDAVVDLRGDMRHIAAIFAAGVPRRISYGITGGGFFLTDNVPYEREKHETEKNAALLRPLNVSGNAGDPEIFSSEEDAAKTGEFKEKENITGSYAVVHTVPGHFTKVWGPDDFSSVVKHIEKKGMKPVLVGTEKDREFAGNIIKISATGALNITGKTGLKDLFHIIKEATLFVGLDSGPGHIASCVRTPAVIIFSGINDVDQWAPRGERIKVVSPEKGDDLSGLDPQVVCAAIDEVMGRNGDI